jgi:membrane protein implicated in regulation of membrane protease activity
MMVLGLAMLAPALVTPVVLLVLLGPLALVAAVSRTLLGCEGRFHQAKTVFARGQAWCSR